MATNTATGRSAPTDIASGTAWLGHVIAVGLVSFNGLDDRKWRVSARSA
ncbi:MAG: hypothetical protein WCP98_02595 [Actinomycetes bacterium]